jgi:hypothetical protein
MQLYNSYVHAFGYVFFNNLLLFHTTRTGTPIQLSLIIPFICTFNTFYHTLILPFLPCLPISIIINLLQYTSATIPTMFMLKRILLNNPMIASTINILQILRFYQVMSRPTPQHFFIHSYTFSFFVFILIVLCVNSVFRFCFVPCFVRTVSPVPTKFTFIVTNFHFCIFFLSILLSNIINCS